MLCAITLLLPTILMGATLPTISRQLDNTPEGVSHLSVLYSCNIFGAVVGCLSAGFYFLRIYDLAFTTYVAVTLNLAAALASVYLAQSCPPTVTARNSDSAADSSVKGRMVYLVIALSGFCAMSAEVVWTRLLSLMMGVTVYAFSIILAVFLAGLAFGSLAVASSTKITKNPRLALAICQLLLALAVGWAAFTLATSLPYWFINPLNFPVQLFRSACAVFPAACLLGASFPLAVASIAPLKNAQAQSVGKLYAANTLGAVLGAVLSSVLLMPWLGSQNLQRLIIGTSAVSGFLMLAVTRRNQHQSFPWSSLEHNKTTGEPRVEKAGSISWVGTGISPVTYALGILVIAALVWTVPRVPWDLVAYGKFLPVQPESGKMLFVGEGTSASVAVSELRISGVDIRRFHISGRVEASNNPYDMRLERMLGLIPALLHPNPRSVLVVGCGAGITAGSFIPYPTVQQVSICELEPLVPKVVARYFGRENYDVVTNPKTRITYDDARNFVLTAKEKFDIITSDPIHPYVKGAAALYTREYFESCKAHLNPDGLVTQWVPLYETSPATVRSELATFFEVFPSGIVWQNDCQQKGYDLVLLGSLKPLKIDLEAIQNRLSRAEYKPVLKSLSEVGFRSTYGLFATYAGQAVDLKSWLKPAEINRDRNLHLEYIAGLGINYNAPDLIYSDMLQHRRFPEELFTGSNIWKEALRSSLEDSTARK
jgi:spermidine synthase